MTASPEPWHAGHLGGLPRTRRDHRPAASRLPLPHRGNPELEDLQQATIRALEIRDEADLIRGLTSEPAIQAQPADQAEIEL